MSTAPDLSAAEAEIVARFEAAPDAPEFLVERVAWAMALSDGQGDEERARGYFRDFPGLYGDRADAALAVFRGQQDPAVQRTVRPLDEARSRLYAWLGDCTSQSDGDEWTHDRLRPAVDQLLARVREVQP